MTPLERPFETHLFTYRHDGAEWVLAIKATDADDARARIGKLAYATYDGVAVSQTSIAHAPIEILSVWVRNATIRLISRFIPPRSPH
jgi:hypothetical protein